MATPLIAASAALVRQYFLEGFYPGGSAKSGAGFAPSGALVKAVLLGGASGLAGFESDTGLPLAPPPSFRQGFGRLHLGRSLPLQARAPAPLPSCGCTQGRTLWLNLHAHSALLWHACARAHLLAWQAQAGIWPYC